MNFYKLESELSSVLKKSVKNDCEEETCSDIAIYEFLDNFSEMIDHCIISARKIESLSLSEEEHVNMRQHKENITFEYAKNALKENLNKAFTEEDQDAVDQNIARVKAEAEDIRSEIMDALIILLSMRNC